MLSTVVYWQVQVWGVGGCGRGGTTSTTLKATWRFYLKISNNYTPDLLPTQETEGHQSVLYWFHWFLFETFCVFSVLVFVVFTLNFVALHNG